MSSDKKFDLDICRGLHGLRDYRFASAPALFWDRGAPCFVGRFRLWLDEAAAFFYGWMTGASACRRVVRVKYLTPYIVVNFAGSSRLGRLGIRRARMRTCHRERLEVIGS